MKVTSEKEISLYDFDAWSGGRDTLRDLSSAQCETIEQYLEDLYPDGIDETDLNDFLWFERDTIAEWLGYSSWEALENGEEEDEDEEEIDGCGLVSYLQPQFDSRASFYNKAVIEDHPDAITLYSYNTAVAMYDKETGVLHVYGYYSSTTARHIREFARQLGVILPKGSDIEGEYQV